ncbi:hypothetical protein F5884DRAFT_340599 [Xylogone sp. PMI_703]|nr:hypothetical protein F5884DRAFT_340599 [Xylogone sp. PMI_703]
MAQAVVWWSKALQLAVYGNWFFDRTKEIPMFRKMYSKVGLTEPPVEGPGLNFTNNYFDTSNTTTTNNTTTMNNEFNQTNIVSTFINDPGKVEKALSIIEMLNGTAPAVGAYATLLSCALQFFHGREAIAELRKMNEHLGRSADAAWGRFSFGDEFPQHVYEFVSNEMKKSRQGNPPKEKGAIAECFFVFNKGNQWWAKFESLCAKDPLPDGFFGSFTDLDILIALIRDVLRPAMGPEMIFTILMPVQSNTLSAQPVMLPRGIGPVHFKGELQESGEPCVYMNFCRLENDTVLDGIGNFPTENQELWRFIALQATFWGTGVPYALACIALSGIPVIGVPLCMISWMGGGALIIFPTVNSVNKAECWKIKVRVLGSTEVHTYEAGEL